MRNEITHLVNNYFTQPTVVEVTENGFTIFVKHSIYGLDTDVDVELLGEILLKGFSLTDINLMTSHTFEGSDDEEKAFALSFSL